MKRREMLGIAATISVAGFAARTMADDTMPAGHEHHASGGRYADLVAATSHCISTGDVCLSHCLTLLGQGDKELAACARTVRDTIAACTALRELAAADSPHVKALAKIVGEICFDCETECKKHEKHPVCKDCEKACHDCKAICEKVAAA